MSSPESSSANRVRPSFLVPAESVEIEFEVKKSRFIARAQVSQSRAAAMEVLSASKIDYPDARHHCWAYLIGNPHSPSTVAMSDDGEPSGTAGKPILNVLQHKGVGDIMLTVIRYFGGVKLGAGGLVRAYSQAAQLAMEKLVTREHVPLRHCVVTGDYAMEQSLRHWLGQYCGSLISVEYGQQVTCQVTVPDQHADLLAEWARYASAELVLD